MKTTTANERRIIFVRPKTAYGRKLYAPVNSLAESFAKIMRRDYFTESDIGELKGLGYSVRTKEEEL